MKAFRILAWALGWLTASLAHAQLDPAEQTLSPYFLIEDVPEGVEPFALESTQVTAHINGVIADVTVAQRYRNGGDVPLNARYVFPASTRAAVHGLQMQLANRRVRAEIRERQQAQREFDAAANSGKTASLLEQQRPNVFSMALANIMPGDQVIVELRYSELLVSEQGVYEFVYPTVVGPRYTGEASGAPVASGPYLPRGDSPDSRLDIRVELAGGVPIAQLQSPSHEIDVNYKDRSFAQARLAKGLGFAGNRDFILRYRLTGTQVESGLLLYEGEHENHFLLMMQPPARVPAVAVPPREYVFVLDVSGSMRGFPLDTAKALLQRLVGALRSSDSFNVLLFSGDSRLLSPRSMPATSTNIRAALELIDDESGGGGTELEAALRRVLALPRAEHISRSVVLITDGYIAQERGAFQLIERNLAHTNVFAFGIGSSVNRYLIEGVARTGRGEPFIVTQPEEASAQAERFRKYIESPVLTDVRVRFHEFDAYEVEPAAQPDLFAERPIVVFGKWRGPKTGRIEVTGQSATGPYVRSMSLAQTPANGHNDALPQLWARSRIARLSDFATRPDEAEAAVTALGLQYSLLTPYTSFIAVLEQIRNPAGAATNASVPVPLALPLGYADMEEGCGDYAAGAEPELLVLLLCALAAIALVMRGRAQTGLR